MSSVYELGMDIIERQLKSSVSIIAADVSIAAVDVVVAIVVLIVAVVPVALGCGGCCFS